MKKRNITKINWAITMLLSLIMQLIPQGAWAADVLETAFIGDKQYYVLRTTEDWEKFRQLVVEAGGNSDVNAIMDADISVTTSVGLDAHTYNGTFDGNGHKLTVDINSGTYFYAAPFPSVGTATIKNLRVYGNVNGGQHSAGLIGKAYGSSQSITIENLISHVTVTTSDRHAGGIIGHSDKAKVMMSDVCSYGYIKMNNNNSYAGAVIGWANSADDWSLHRVWEYVSFVNVNHQAFCYYNSNNAWGYNDKSTTCLSYHNWGEIKEEYRNIWSSATDICNKELAGSWKDGWPVIDSWPTADDVNFQTYDMVPGTESGEEGMLKIPFSCDKPIKYIDVSYTDENGYQTKLDRINFSSDTYAGFICVPATKQHKDMRITAKLVVGSITITRKTTDDATMHKPEDLTASVMKFSTNNVLTDAGAVELKWKVASPDYNDIMEGDQFTILRSLTGNEQDYQIIGSVLFEKGVSSYTYKDSTLVSALAADKLNGGSATVQYRVIRATAQQLWGMTYTPTGSTTIQQNPVMASTNVTLSNLHLLKVNTDYEADWESTEERTIHVTWNYGNETGAVWDSRAQMKMLITSVNRNNEPVDSTYIPLTTEELTKHRKVVQLPRSCVYYTIEFVSEFGEDSKHYKTEEEPKDRNFTISTAADWNTFVSMINQAEGKYGINAWLMTDISVTTQAGQLSTAPYRGVFEGNGHTITVNITGNEQCNAPFRYVTNATIRNLHTVGTITTSQKFAAGLVSRVLDNSSLLIEGCHISVDINSSVNGDATNGGIVALGNNGTTITLHNTKFDGKLRGANCYANGGMVGYSTGQVNIINSLFAPTEISTKIEGCQTWARINSPGRLTVTNSQCVREYIEGTWRYNNRLYFVLRNANDWETFRQRVKEAKGQMEINAIMAADLSVNTIVAESESEPYIGHFLGNGHTLTVNIDNGDTKFTAPFGFVRSCLIERLNVKGSVKGGMHSSGFIGSIIDRQSCIIQNVHVSVDVTTTSTHLGGFIGHANRPTIVNIANSIFDGSLTAISGSEQYGGAFIGWMHEGGDCYLAKLYENGTYNNIAHAGYSYFYDGSAHPFSGTDRCISSHNQNWDEVVESYRNITDPYEIVSLMGDTPIPWMIVGNKAVPYMETVNVPDATVPSADELLAALGDGWKKNANDKVVPQTYESQPIADDNAPTGQFYYESLGQIVENSLKTETQQSSVVLTWEKTEDTVDYFRIERRNVTTDGKWETIASQVIYKEYEDKTALPVFDYEYRVTSVNQCEGLHETTSDIVAGHCVKTGKVEGYVRFADGSGIPGIRISVSPYGDGADPTMGGSATTNEAGFYSIDSLEYWGEQQGAYAVSISGIASTDLSDDCKDGLYVTFTAQSNYIKNKNFTVTSGVRFSGLVMYKGTSIPVKGAHFLVDGNEVNTGSGAVESDFEGKFSFRMLRGQHTVQAVMDGHTFTGEGYYVENQKTEIDFQTDVANTYFYDATLVKLIGRVAGGHVQGELPLGNSLSNNNLGDSLKMVLTLEGDNASWLVFENTNRALTTRDAKYTHKKYDNIDNNEYFTRVHTERHRMEVYPDKHTGEYEVLLPPVKWKIQQITAEGYATLFQDGQTSDVIDLTDSLTLHTDTVKGQWKSRGGVAFKEAIEEYNAKYSRIYHSPVLLEYSQQGYDKFEYFGEKTYILQPIKGVKKQIPIAYSVKKENWPEGKKDSLKTLYTFGHPVFSTDRGYGIKLSAVERYYYNNLTQSDTVDVVKLNGGFVTIRNGLVSGTQRDTLTLDSLGEGFYTLRADRTPYMLTGTGALCTVTFTMERNGATFEGTPLQGYVFSQQTATGAQDIISINRPVLVDILRDPPGGGSSAKLSKGSSLKLAYQVDMAWSAGLTIGVSAGGGMDGFSGVVAAPMGGGATFGMNYSSSSAFSTSLDIIFSGTGQRAFSYTMTANEDISTDAGNTMVGADADLYMGMETNLFARPAVAIQALTDSVFHSYEGALKAGRMVEIATGRDENDSIYHLVRSEVISYGQTINSTFVHSQQYLMKQLLPNLAKECESLMFTGTMADAQALANSKKERVYLSLITDTESERFGVMNTDKNGNYVYHTTNSSYQAENPSLMNYIIVLPNGDDGTKQEDRVQDISNAMYSWASMIARNEKEKLEATDKVKNFELDGGGSISYSEDFATDYSNASTYNWIGTDVTHSFFDDPETTAAQDAGTTFTTMASVLGPTVAKLLGSVLKTTAGKSSAYMTPAGVKTVPDPFQKFEIKFIGLKWAFSLTPVIAYNTTPKLTEDEKYNRKESFTIKMDKKSHLSFDLYRVAMIDSREETNIDGRTDVFVEENFLNSKDYVKYFIDKGVGSRDVSKAFQEPRSFVYRTVGGATVRPWEKERKTTFYREGTILDVRTKKIENPIIKMDRQSVSGIPHNEPARFKLYMTNESEQPEAVDGALLYYSLYLDGQSNPKGARITVDGIPLSASGTTVKLQPGEVTEKTMEVWAGDDFDYENLQLGVVSQGDVQCFDQVEFSVHFLPTAGNIEITSPGDKWIMNCDAPSDVRKGWYLPVIISGFNKNQQNFDHIEFQYKESTRGDDYWTNLCGYYADSTLYKQATGTHEMIPENGNIVAKFYGDGTVMEKAYDLRARLFRRYGNSFITSDSKVLSGIKDTRRPQVFGTVEPKDGILGAGDNIIFNFSEHIEYNYLQQATNFEVVGETNETTLQEEPSLYFGGNGYAETDARRNFAGKSVTVDVMVRPDDTGKPMPIFSHGNDGNNLQLWLTEDWRLMAKVNSVEYISTKTIKKGFLQHVAMTIDYDNKNLLLYNDSIIGTFNNVKYDGYGTLIFGSTNENDVSERSHYQGRMLEARIWNRTMSEALLNTYGKRILTGYEMGLVDYYPMNEGDGDYAIDKAQGANALLVGATWILPRGMSLRLSREEEKAVKGVQLKQDFIQRSAEQDYTLMFWFKSSNKGGAALLSNGSGHKTDDDAANKFFIGIEESQLKYRSNGLEVKLGMGYDDDKWHHYAMTMNRGRKIANIYVDRILKASVPADTLGGMMGDDFYLGNMVWHEAGANVGVLHQQNALTGNIDELYVFAQALPPTLLKRYSTKQPNGDEKGLLTFLSFSSQEKQENNNIELRPNALNRVIHKDMDGKPTNVFDSVFVDNATYIINHIDQEVAAPVQANMELKNLAFSYVGRDNQILVNIDETDSRVNKRNVFVTLYDIPDQNGNYMASPATAEFFIDRNPLRWERKLWEETIYNMSSYDHSFNIKIANNSGSAHTYTISNLPRWLTVDHEMDIIEAMSDRNITFYVNKDLNIGTYDETIYLIDENGLAEPLALFIDKEGTAPDKWYVDYDLKRYSMNVVARVKIKDAIVIDKEDIVAAFDNDGRCMGMANIDYNPNTGKSMLYLTVFDSTVTEKPLTFKLWHHQTGKVMMLETSKAITFAPGIVEGSVNDPIIMTAGNIYIQTLKLNPAWNWISFNVYNDKFRNVNNLLEGYKWQNGDVLVDDTEDLTLVYNEKWGKWMKNKTDAEVAKIRIWPSRSYRIYLSDYAEVEVTGDNLDQESMRTITVHKGWNSVGYTPQINLPVSTALTDYTPFAKDRDVIKSREEFATYTETKSGTGYWSGSLRYMKPGEGYMLYRNGKDTISFKYPYYEPGSTFFENTIAEAKPTMFYELTMSLAAEVEGVEIEEGDNLLALNGAEVRGKAVLIDSVYYMSINGDASAKLSFAIERDGEIIATSATTIPFEANKVIGSPVEPAAIDFNSVDTEVQGNGWFTIDGKKLSRKPKKPGIYVHDGKTVVVE